MAKRTQGTTFHKNTKKSDGQTSLQGEPSLLTIIKWKQRVMHCCTKTGPEIQDDFLKKEKPQTDMLLECRLILRVSSSRTTTYLQCIHTLLKTLYSAGPSALDKAPRGRARTAQTISQSRSLKGGPELLTPAHVGARHSQRTYTSTHTALSTSKTAPQK